MRLEENCSKRKDLVFRIKLFGGEGRLRNLKPGREARRIQPDQRQNTCANVTMAGMDFISTLYKRDMYHWCR